MMSSHDQLNILFWNGGSSGMVQYLAGRASGISGHLVHEEGRKELRVSVRSQELGL